MLTFGSSNKTAIHTYLLWFWLASNYTRRKPEFHFWNWWPLFPYFKHSLKTVSRSKYIFLYIFLNKIVQQVYNFWRQINVISLFQNAIILPAKKHHKTSIPFQFLCLDLHNYLPFCSFSFTTSLCIYLQLVPVFYPHIININYWSCL